MKDVFVVAMECEADAVVRNLEGVLKFEECGRTVYQGELRGEKTAVVVCGVGKVNAAAGTQYAIDHFEPERIVNLGVAGGIDASMKIAELYSVSKCFQCDFDLSLINHTPKGTVNEYDTPFFELEPYDRDPSRGRSGYDGDAGCGGLEPYDRDPSRGRSGYDGDAGCGGLKSAIVASGDFFANDNRDRAFVYDEMGAWLRDMELGAIAHVCKRAGMRCCSLKSVSDVNYPGCPPPASQYADNLKRAVDALASRV